MPETTELETTPPVTDRPQGGLRISLKWWLVLLVVGGAGLGLLGRSFFQYPEVFMAIVSIGSTIVPFLLAVGTLIVLGVRQRRRGLTLWGIALTLMPLIGLGCVALISFYFQGSPGGLSAKSTQQLITQEVSQQYDQPWVWNELSVRLARGDMTQSQVDTAILELAKQMKANSPNGWQSPLSWQSDFLTAAQDANLLGDEAILALCDAFYGSQPKLDALPRLREGDANIPLSLQFGNTWGQHSNLPLALAWQVSRVLVDGKPIDFKTHYQHRDQWNGSIEVKLDKGEHQVQFELEAAYIDSDKMVGLDIDDIPARRWPQAVKKWSLTVDDKLTVYGPQDQLVALSTSAEDTPGPFDVQVQRIVIQKGTEGKSKAILKLKFGESANVPLSFDIDLSVGGQVVSMGSTFYYRTEQSIHTGGDEFQQPIELLDESVNSASVRLVPNPARIEKFGEVTKIWGNPIIWRNLPIDRYDLDTQEASDE